MEKNNKKLLAEQKVRQYVRKKLIEHYSTNGLGDLSPKDVQKRLLQLEAKKLINDKPKQDNKALGSKKSIGNSAPNADWITSNNPAKKDVQLEPTKTDPTANKVKSAVAKYFKARGATKKNMKNS